MRSLADKVALVTGAGRGIGKAIALSLAASGCRTILTARTTAQLQEVRREIQDAGGDAAAVTGDLTYAEDIERVAAESSRIYGPVDRIKLEDLDRTLNVNLRAPILLARYLVPGMIEKSAGAVINIGSVSGKSGEANGAAYSASKFGLIGFTQALYEEVREHGIKVAVILPGFVDTPLIPPTRQLDRSKMIQPGAIAACVHYILDAPPTCCPVEITVRPQKTPYRSG
jgi:3-oxoacyl-[acyl-carrier protein] reductase